MDLQVWVEIYLINIVVYFVKVFSNIHNDDPRLWPDARGLNLTPSAS